MFASRQRGTLIAKGLKIVGSVTAEGLVEVNGQIDGELHCTSLVIARGAHVNGIVAAEHVVVDGTVEGPIHGGDVTLKSQAHVVGDIHHLLPLKLVPSLTVARYKFEETDKRLRNLKRNQTGRRASLAGLSAPNPWRPISLPKNSIGAKHGCRLRPRGLSNHLASAIGLLPSFSAYAWGSGPQLFC